MMNNNETKVNHEECIDYFGSQANAWVTLYETKVQFQDRFALFVKEVHKHLSYSGRILDFGCGPGILSIALACEGYEVTGVDGAERMIDVAKQRSLRSGLSNISFKVMDAKSFSIEPESYDAVVCSSVLEYVADDTKLLCDLVKVLRPGGVLLVSVPHTASLLGKIEDTMMHVPGLKRGPGRMDLKYCRRRYDIEDFLNSLYSLSLESFECTFFEVPLLGKYGIRLSRYRRLGMMLLVSAVKWKNTISSAKAVTSRRSNNTKSKQRLLTRKAIWDDLPPAFKASFGRVLGILPTRFTLGKQFVDNIRFLRSVQSWPGKKSVTYQMAQLRNICRLAYEKTEYYKRAFVNAGIHPSHLKSFNDFLKIPTIDGCTVDKHLWQMLTVPPSHPLSDYGSTGGTGGKPLSFYMNADRSPTEYSYLVVSWERTGYKLGMPMAVLRGRVVNPDRNGFRHEYDPILRHHYYSSFYMSDENIARYLEHIATIGPCFLHVYPSSVATLARFILRKGTQAPKNVQGIIAESETVYPEQRQMAEEVFGCRYFSCYGQSEKIVLGAGCEKSDDYHIWPTYGYFELLDDNGNPVTTPGQRGEIVGTGFINTVMPFIRYRTGDWATYVAERCEACGREHTVIRDIRGHRTQEILIAADGSEISWTALNMHDDTFVRVRQFQFVQETPGKAVLRIVPADGFGEDDADRIHRNLERKLDRQLTFTIELTETIPLSPRGKAIYVDQRIPQEKGILSDSADTI